MTTTTILKYCSNKQRTKWKLNINITFLTTRLCHHELKFRFVYTRLKKTCNIKKRKCKIFLFFLNIIKLSIAEILCVELFLLQQCRIISETLDAENKLVLDRLTLWKANIISLIDFCKKKNVNRPPQTECQRTRK